MSGPLSLHESSIQVAGHVSLLDDGENEIETKQPCVRYRYLMAVLASFGFMMAQGTRTSLNIALVAMVNYTAESPINSSEIQCPQSHVHHNKSLPQYQGQFDWDSTVQSQLLSAFYYGYIITQLPGGYLAERVGSTWVFGLTVLIPGILSLLHPLLAHWDYRALLAARVMMGFLQGPLLPSNQALWGRWAPPLERSRLISISTAGALIGILVSLVLTGYLCSLPYLGGWPMPFYVWGAGSCLWFILWRIFSADTPTKSCMISVVERDYIERCTGHLDTKPYIQPPWCKILTCKAVWALAIYLICDGIGYFVVFTGFPIYMKEALGYDISLEGQLTALPPLASVIIGLLSSVLADYILSKHWLSTTAVRKIFTFIGECSMAIAIIGVGLADCDHILVVILYIIGYGLSGITSSGIGVVTLDMAPQYAGTLLGIANLINSCGGFLAPAIVGLVTDNEGDKYRWQIMFYLTGGCFAVGLLVFMLFGSAETQSWALTQSDPDDPDNNDNSDDVNNDRSDHSHDDIRQLVS